MHRRRFGARLHTHAEPLPPANPVLNQRLPLSPFVEGEPTPTQTPLATPTPTPTPSVYPQVLAPKPTSLSAPLPSISVDMSRSRSPSSFRRFMRTPEPQRRNYSDDSDETGSSSHGSTSGAESISVGMQRQGPGSHSTSGIRARLRPHLSRNISLDTALPNTSSSSVHVPRSPVESVHTPSPLSNGSSAEETEKEQGGDTPATTPEPEYEESILIETEPVNGKRAVRKDSVPPILQAYSAMAVWK